MKKIVMIFSVLFVSPLWGMEKANKDWFITALNERMKSRDPIVLCFQKVKNDDDTSEIAMLNTVRKGIQDVAKADLQTTKNSVSRSLGIALSDETKKAYAHEMNNGWIALCINMPYVNGGWMTVQKYYVSSKKWESGKEIHCGLPQGCIYRDLENSDMVVLNIPYGDNDDSIDSCYTLIRSLKARGIPLLVNSDRRLLKDLWNNLDDLFPEKDDIKVFSNGLLADSDSDDTDGHSSTKTFSGRSESDDIFPYDDDSHNHHKLDSKEDSVDSLTQSEDSSEVSGDTVQNDNNGDDNNESTTEDIFAQTPSEDIFATPPSGVIQQVLLQEKVVEIVADAVRGDVVTEDNSAGCVVF